MLLLRTVVICERVERTPPPHRVDLMNLLVTIEAPAGQQSLRQNLAVLMVLERSPTCRESHELTLRLEQPDGREASLPSAHRVPYKANDFLRVVEIGCELELGHLCFGTHRLVVEIDGRPAGCAAFFVQIKGAAELVRN